MKNFHDLESFDRQILINRVGRTIAKFQGWQVDINGNILESTNPRLRSYANLASAVIEEIEVYSRNWRRRE